MIELGRPEVLGWQRTVDSAWQQRDASLAGEPGQSELDAARAEFFDRMAPPGAEREVLQTGATVPGGRDGIIVSRFFIATEMAAFGTLYGDGREHSTDPTAGYRFAIAWDTRTGQVSVTVSSSTVDNFLLPDVDVPAHPITTHPGGEPNNFVVDEATPDHLRVSYNALNSVIPIGQANGSVDIRLGPDSITVTPGGDNYPDGEVIQYRPQGSRLLLAKDMSPFQEGAVIPGIDSVDKWPFTVPRQTVPR